MSFAENVPDASSSMRLKHEQVYDAAALISLVGWATVAMFDWPFFPFDALGLTVIALLGVYVRLRDEIADVNKGFKAFRCPHAGCNFAYSDDDAPRVVTIAERHGRTNHSA